MSDLAKLDRDHAALDLLIRGFQISRMIRAIADLGVADRIPPGEHRDVGELAAAAAVLREPLLRLLRALAAFGIFQVRANGSITHSPRSLHLRTDAPNSLHYAARFFSTPGSWSAWAALDVALRGLVPHEEVWHTNRFEYLRDHPEEARTFDEFMAHSPGKRHQAVVLGYDFSGARLIVDVGGGNGETLRQILARFPMPRGLLFDREDVVAAITPEARSAGRIEVEQGSFFDGVPPGGDIYLLNTVLHDWSDENCVRILRNCRAAMSLTARLLIVEQILEPDPSLGHPLSYLSDMQMMAMFGSARERTYSEFRALVEESGFSSARLIPTSGAVSIVETMPH